MTPVLPFQDLLRHQPNRKQTVNLLSGLVTVLSPFAAALDADLAEHAVRAVCACVRACVCHSATAESHSGGLSHFRKTWSDGNGDAHTPTHYSDAVCGADNIDYHHGYQQRHRRPSHGYRPKKSPPKKNGFWCLGCLDTDTLPSLVPMSTHMSTHVSIHVSIHMHRHVSIQTCVYTDMCLYRHVSVQTCVRTDMCLCR